MDVPDDDTYLLFFNMKTQNNPDRKNSNDIIEYKAGSGISPALR